MFYLYRSTGHSYKVYVVNLMKPCSIYIDLQVIPTKIYVVYSHEAVFYLYRSTGHSYKDYVVNLMKPCSIYIDLQVIPTKSM